MSRFKQPPSKSTRNASNKQPKGFINQAPNFTYPSLISIYESTQNPLPQQKIKKTNKNTKIYNK